MLEKNVLAIEERRKNRLYFETIEFPPLYKTHYLKNIKLTVNFCWTLKKMDTSGNV